MPASFSHRLRFPANGSTHRPAPLRGGFTLLEVLLAGAIFVIVTSAIYNTFRITTDAFEKGRGMSSALQSLRFSMDQMTRDLKSVYYESNYDLRFLMIEDEVLQNSEQVLRDFESGFSETLGGLPTGLEREDKKKPGDLGRRVELRFRGIGGGENGAGALEFTHLLPGEADMRGSSRGLERVRYFVSDGRLYRQAWDPAGRMRFREDLDIELSRVLDEVDGQRLDPNDAQAQKVLRGVRGPLPEGIPPFPEVDLFAPVKPADIPPPELLAENITSFQVQFGYFSGDWTEVGTWDSESRAHRTPALAIDQEDQAWMQKLSVWRERDTDGLPSYMRVKMSIKVTTDKVGSSGPSSGSTGERESAPEPREQRRRRVRDKEGPVKTMETVIWAPAAQETYLPEDEELFVTDEEASR